MPPAVSQSAFPAQPIIKSVTAVKKPMPHDLFGGGPNSSVTTSLTVSSLGSENQDPHRSPIATDNIQYSHRTQTTPDAKSNAAKSSATMNGVVPSSLDLMGFSQGIAQPPQQSVAQVDGSGGQPWRQAPPNDDVSSVMKRSVTTSIGAATRFQVPSPSMSSPLASTDFTPLKTQVPPFVNAPSSPSQQMQSVPQQHQRGLATVAVQPSLGKPLLETTSMNKDQIGRSQRPSDTHPPLSSVGPPVAALGQGIRPQMGTALSSVPSQELLASADSIMFSRTGSGDMLPTSPLGEKTSGIGMVGLPQAPTASVPAILRSTQEAPRLGWAQRGKQGIVHRRFALVGSCCNCIGLLTLCFHFHAHT